PFGIWIMKGFYDTVPWEIEMAGVTDGASRFRVWHALVLPQVQPGLAALLIEAHPEWSPAAVRSAMMTSARQDVLKEDETTPADPFDFGAGHVDPNYAVDPGLIYEAGQLDYLAASCGTGTPLVSAGDCTFLESIGFSLDPSDLNLPSIGIAELPGSQTVTRTVTNVAFRGNGVYKAHVEAPEGFDVTVHPAELHLAQGESATYEVTITNVSAPPGEYRFGSLTWVQEARRKNRPPRFEVRSPIAVNATAIIAPAAVAGTGSDGSSSFEITFGYNGDYTAGVHGINTATPFLFTVEDDPGNSFAFFGPGTTIAFLEEFPAGTAYAQFDTFNEYTTGNDDVDLYLYYCPNLSCTLIDSSGNVDSREQVSVLFPMNDPAIDDPYLIFAHGFNTEGGAPADGILFVNSVGVVDDAGNLSVTAPNAATIGATETIDFSWTGLPVGVGAKQLGAISHSDANGIQGLTVIDVTNDAGFGICDFGVCTP
ncbi:MAG: hypothetical protein AAFZ58_09715, partial [Pseudomonadota bacterium]